MTETLTRSRLIMKSRIFKFFVVSVFVGIAFQLLSLISLSQIVRISDNSTSFNTNLARFSNFGLKVAAVAPHRWLEKALPGESEVTRKLLMAEAAARTLAVDPELLEFIIESENRKELLTEDNLVAVSSLGRKVRPELEKIESLAIGKPDQNRIAEIFNYEVLLLINTANSVLDFAVIAPDFFGCTQPTEVLLLLTSSAEARSVGGLIGQYLQIDFNCESFNVSRVGANSDLFDNVIFDNHLARYSGLYSGVNPEWVNSNLIFDLDNLAPAWATAYNQQFDSAIEFVALVDTELLAALLAFDGGITAADGTNLITSDEIVAYLQNGVYYQFVDDQIARKEHLKQITQNFAATLTLEKLTNLSLFSAYFNALKHNRILLYPVADELKYLLDELHSISWSSKELNTIYVGINNLSGSKFDFYSTNKITIKNCRKNQTELSLEISNIADANASYPDYVNRRLDGYPDQATGVLNEIILMVPTGQFNLEVLKLPAFATSTWALGESGYDIFRVIEFVAAKERARFQFTVQSSSDQPLYLRGWGHPTQQINPGRSSGASCN